MASTSELLTRGVAYDAETCAFHATCRFMIGYCLDHGQPTASQRGALHQCLIVCRPYAAEQCAPALEKALTSGLVYHLFAVSALGADGASQAQGNRVIVPLV